jgi:hypothetical protein
MRAVARLIVTYFAGTRLLMVVTVLGIACIAGGTGALLYLPPLVAQHGLPSRFTLAEETILQMLPVAGILCFVFGASLLPTMFIRLATSHYAYVLPYGRAKLLASAFGTVALVALVASATVSIYYKQLGFSLGLMFQRAFSVSLVSYTILYGVLWFIGRSGSIGKLVGTAAAVATLVLPLRLMIPGTPFAGVWIACALLWATLGTFVLLGPRFKLAYGRARHSLAERFGGASYRGGGREIDFLLGIANPWPLALGQIAPVVIATYYLSDYHPLAAEAPPNPLLFFMTILSVVSGGMTSVAATRARALWLRAHCTRAQLFARVERAFWGYNSFVLGVLLVTLVAVGSWLDLPTKMLAFGLGLLMLGTALSTYLGLIVTASIGWTECVLATATMVALMMTSTYTASPAMPSETILALQGGLAAAALAFRQLAARRWARLDWMRCRADPTVRASA